MGLWGIIRRSADDRGYPARLALSLGPYPITLDLIRGASRDIKPVILRMRKSLSEGLACSHL